MKAHLLEERGLEKRRAALRVVLRRLALRRLRLPARRKGAGVRSRLDLAPAAYCASAVEAMECFLPGEGSTGFWAVLEPVFGAGAFAAGGHRLEHWLDTMTPEAMSFFQAWMRCQAEVRDTDVRGPLDQEPRLAGVGSQGRLQHAITVQREQVEHQRLSDLIEGLSHAHPARSSWLEVGEFAQTLITSWPSENTGCLLYTSPSPRD